MSEKVIKPITTKVGKLVDTIIDPINARLSNPLIGSFTISFIILNWKPILYLVFGDHTILTKYEYISEKFYGSGLCNWSMYLFVPLAMSLAYVLALPRLEN